MTCAVSGRSTPVCSNYGRGWELEHQPHDLGVCLKICPMVVGHPLYTFTIPKTHSLFGLRLPLYTHCKDSPLKVG